MGFRVMRFRAPPVGAPASVPVSSPSGLPAGLPVTANIGYPTAEAQQAGIDHLMRVAAEQAAARLLGPVDDPSGADRVRRTGPNAALPGGDRDGTPEAYRHI
jgi:hypothetical protein